MSDWKETLAAVAPNIATALGGPLGGMAATMALKALGIEPGDHFGDPQGKLEHEVAHADPAVLAQLKKVDNDFKVEMRRLKIDIHKIDAADRASARGMATAKGFAPQVFLSMVFVTGFVMVLWYLFGGEKTIHENMMQPAMYVLGILSAGIVQIMNFWFGSSSGSKAKTMHLSQAGR